MKSRILKSIAKNYKQDPDVVLVALWDIKEGKFDYLKNENSIIKKKDLRFVKKVASSEFKKESLYGELKKNESPEVVCKNYNFSTIGRIINPILFITREEILRIHEELVADFKDLDDPIYPVGLKSEHLLDSALYHAQTAYSGKVKYPTIESAGAALMYSISNNHAFHNGNKRTAIVSLLVFLDKHNICLNCHEDDLFNLSIKVADHKLVEKRYLCSDAEIYELARWIHRRSKFMRKGERPITLKKFKQILTHFDCNILGNGKIERKVRLSFLGLSRIKTLISKSIIGDTIADGHDVEKSLVKSIREELELDSIHGIDSDIFYGKVEFSSSEFIVKYKNLLRRLSKV